MRDLVRLWLRGAEAEHGEALVGVGGVEVDEARGSVVFGGRHGADGDETAAVGAAVLPPDYAHLGGGDGLMLLMLLLVGVSRLLR